MELVVYILAVGVSGLIVGALARLSLPGPDPMGLLATALLGIGGSLLAGIAARVFFDAGVTPGILLSVVAAALILLLIRRTQGRGLRG